MQIEIMVGCDHRGLDYFGTFIQLFSKQSIVIYGRVKLKKFKR